MLMMVILIVMGETRQNNCSIPTYHSDNGIQFCKWIESLADAEDIPDIDMESVKESVLVLSEMENDEDPEEWETARITLDRVSSKLAMESPLKTMIDSFKTQYNINVNSNDFAVFV